MSLKRPRSLSGGGPDEVGGDAALSHNMGGRCVVAGCTGIATTIMRGTQPIPLCEKHRNSHLGAQPFSVILFFYSIS